MYKTSVRQGWPLTGAGLSRTSTFSSFQPYQITGERLDVETSISDGHGFRDGHWTGGGPWTLTRDRTTYAINQVNTNLVKGPVHIRTPNQTLGNLAPFVPKTDMELFGMGGTAISRVEPTSPSFSLSQSLGELRREGLPRLPDTEFKSAVDVARKSGGNYLNLDFGWAPLMRDLRSFLTSVRDSDEILRNYHSGSNQGQHRRYTFPEEEGSQTDVCTFSYTPGITALGVLQGSQVQRKSQSVWFSGRFVYHVPSTATQRDKLARWGSDARHLLGLEITPEVCWNLAPWSWAADWFGTYGDVLHNVSALGRDGMVMSYGFIMCHTRKETIRSGSNSTIGSISSFRVEETKSRRMASPYGFGVNESDFSARQVATLVALGLSRV
jgi:hypothetical protein